VANNNVLTGDGLACNASDVSRYDHDSRSRRMTARTRRMPD
jgi:hypothetical protein